METNEVYGQIWIQICMGCKNVSRCLLHCAWVITLINVVACISNSRIRIFRKKAGAHSVSFVYEISPEVRFSPTGFVSANAPYESPTGLNSFPCIYSYPPVSA